MRKSFSYAFAIGFAVTPLMMPGCASKSENDDSMEAGEPVDAAAAPDAKAPEAPTPPSSSIAVPSDPAGQPAVAAPSAAPLMKTGRRVMYVKVNGAVLRETADPKGKAVGKLDKGDHILVTVEGDWARTDDGKFISAKVLSDKGIGRGKKDAQWTGGSPGAAAPAPAAKPASTKVDGAKKDKVKTDASKGAAPEAAPAAKTDAAGAEEP
jgi:hypothetical protein